MHTTPKSIGWILAWLIFAGTPALAQEGVQEEPTWAFQEALFTLYAKPSSHVRLRAGYGSSPDADSLGFVLEGAWAIGDIGVHLRMPLGLAMGDDTGTAFTYGDAEIGAQWLIVSNPENQRHLAVGLDLVGPTSRIGEKDDVAAVQAGTLEDDSNFGRRYLLAQKPMLDMGLIPRLNLALRPWVGFGQNIGRVSLQADFGFLILIMDNMDESIYGTDRRVGLVLFLDLATPVAITRELALVAEFNALVALDELTGTGFAVTLGPRYQSGAISAGVGVQVPLGVDNKPPDDDKRLGRFDQALVVRQHVSAILDLTYRF